MDPIEEDAGFRPHVTQEQARVLLIALAGLREAMLQSLGRVRPGSRTSGDVTQVIGITYSAERQILKAWKAADAPDAPKIGES